MLHNRKTAFVNMLVRVGIIQLDKIAVVQRVHFPCFAVESAFGGYYGSWLNAVLMSYKIKQSVGINRVVQSYT